MCPDFSITIPFMLLALTPSYYIFAESANLFCLSLPDKTAFSINIYSIRFLNSIVSSLYKNRRTRFFKVVHDLNNPVLRFISYDSLFPDINLTFVRFCVYSINIASRMITGVPPFLTFVRFLLVLGMLICILSSHHYGSF